MIVKKFAKGRPHLIVASALFVCLAQVSSARADFGSCIANSCAYVVELDELLSREENRLAPYDDLDERFLPLHDCKADVLLEVVKRSRFIRSIDYRPFAQEYVIYFSSYDVTVGISYLASEKRSNFQIATWVNK